MASEFDQLESDVRRRARSAPTGYPTDLPIPTRGAPPPPVQVAQIKGLPEGYTAEAPPAINGLPEGYTVEPPSGGKVGRFLENVTPQGPISGLIALMRTSSQAAKGQRPDLLTNPEGAVPEAVQGAIAGTGARARVPRTVPKAAPEPAPPPEPLQLTSRLSPEEAHAIAREQDLAPARAEAKRVAQRLRDTGQMPAESSGPPVEVSGPTSAPYSLPSAQTIREFGAVQKGVALRDKLNPASEQNVSARDQAMISALRPHIKTIVGRSEASIAALEGALPENVLTEAMSKPPKAASIANWLQVYERAARGKFSPQAKASLDLATRNLNNNLGTDLTLKDVLRSP